jgi:hypothetical protein
VGIVNQPKNKAVEIRTAKKTVVTVSLRIPASMLKEIDKAVKARPYKIPRHSWLLEAVHEKLARLKSGDTIQA